MLHRWPVQTERWTAPPADPPPPATPLADTGCAAGAEPDVARPTESPITAHIAAAAATIHRRLLFASHRRTRGRRACLPMGAEADQSGEEAGAGGGAAPVPPELSPADGSEVAPGYGATGEGVVGVCWSEIAHDGAPVTRAAMPKVPTVPWRSLGPTVMILRIT